MDPDQYVRFVTGTSVRKVILYWSSTYTIAVVTVAIYVLLNSLDEVDEDDEQPCKHWTEATFFLADGSSTVTGSLCTDIGVSSDHPLAESPDPSNNVRYIYTLYNTLYTCSSYRQKQTPMVVLRFGWVTKHCTC